ncbi:MAG: hypothetical protein ACI3ZL_01905 [Candidatus Cryptobacteroides sp.]
MRNIFIHCFLPLLFIWYISGITLFSHTHIVDGVRIVHSHPNPDAEHQDKDSFVTISMLSLFQTCGTGEGVSLPLIATLDISGSAPVMEIPLPFQRYCRYFGLRAPPQTASTHC